MVSLVKTETPLPWHSRELPIQKSAGVEQTAADLGRRFIRADAVAAVAEPARQASSRVQSPTRKFRQLSEAKGWR